jgi:hypothetical protein
MNVNKRQILKNIIVRKGNFQKYNCWRKNKKRIAALEKEIFEYEYKKNCDLLTKQLLSWK